MKTEKLWFRALPADKQALEQIAQAEGESMAVVMRKLIRQAARDRGIVPSAPKEDRYVAQPIS